MALFSPSESPAIVVKEVDLTGGVPNVQSSTGAYVGNFVWGPAEQRTLIGSETKLVSKFGAPNTTTATDFISAAMFLKYSGSMYVTRMVDSAAVNASSEGLVTAVIKNQDHFDQQAGTFGVDEGEQDTGAWVARYPGAAGNSIKVSVCPAGAGFASWSYKGLFDSAPATSEYAEKRGGLNDEVHVVVIDEDGDFTGVPGSVLETYPYMSLASDAKNSNGSTNYIMDIINKNSDFVWLTTFEGTLVTLVNAGSPAAGITFSAGATVVDSSLVGGIDSGALGVGDYQSGFDLYGDTDTVTVDFLIAPAMATSADQITVTNYVAGIAVGRKDCVAVSSPAIEDIVNASTPVDNAVTTASGFTYTSYLVVDSGYLKVYDKYNDQFIFVPAASSTAGLMAATDINSAAWFSPAGQRRGAYLGITALAYSPSKLERDTLYKAGINPVANIPGQGTLLYGDKTHMARPSAFDRINVRRLFLVLERAIAIAARNVVFEFNDEFTRAEFVNIIEPTLREVKGRRGITDFKVVCDESNNTPEVVDRNEFIANVFIKPARSINYVTLNFVAVRTGVEFEEVVGTV